ncbi:MAG: thiol-disulfide oxidoreductase DCC family protein [Phycisphaerae bacterium]|nr:thiol-disulfide oxidoreductase DCC family protein [Phycisphaerae bacterium]
MPDHDGRAVVLFDGVCNLCNGSVRFIVRRDRAGRIAFAPLGSPAAARVLSAAGVEGVALPDSLVLVRSGRVHVCSGAALRIAGLLRWPWPVLTVLLAIPWPLRDWVYRWVARNRYRWFGRRETCMMPTPELRSRFLAD